MHSIELDESTRRSRRAGR